MTKAEREVLRLAENYSKRRTFCHRYCYCAKCELLRAVRRLKKEKGK